MVFYYDEYKGDVDDDDDYGDRLIDWLIRNVIYDAWYDTIYTTLVMTLTTINPPLIRSHGMILVDIWRQKKHHLIIFKRTGVS